LKVGQWPAKNLSSFPRLSFLLFLLFLLVVLLLLLLLIPFMLQLQLLQLVLWSPSPIPMCFVCLLYNM
jgi:hypothetical protein